jgi:hypothetical protein
MNKETGPSNQKAEEEENVKMMNKESKKNSPWPCDERWHRGSGVPFKAKNPIFTLSQAFEA